MNKNEYVKFYNDRQPPGVRKISIPILTKFEEKNNFSSEYFQHIELMEKIRDFVRLIPHSEYLKLSGEKITRRRDPSLFKNTRIEIKAFPIDEELGYEWEFLAYDLETGQKYCWNELKRDIEDSKNENQTYFNLSEVLDEFIALDLKDFPLSQEEKQKIIDFLKKYGPYFIDFYVWEDRASKDKEEYFRHFWMQFIYFKKSYEFIQKRRPSKFPHATTPPRILNQLYNRKNVDLYIKWQKDIDITQLWFKVCLTYYKLPTLGKPPYNFFLGGRGIGAICNYLYQNCAQLTQCQYPPCGKFFFKSRKDQVACCSHHSLLLRVRRYKKKIQK